MIKIKYYEKTYCEFACKLGSEPTCRRQVSERRKHPTQKPLPLLARIILASTKENAWILDPFAGSSTTGIAANLFNRRFLGIEKETEFLEMSKRRREEIENPLVKCEYKKRISKYSDKPQRNYEHYALAARRLQPDVSKSVNERSRNEFGMTDTIHENVPYFGVDLPF